MPKPSLSGLPVIILVCSSIFWGLSWMPVKFLNGAGFDGVFLVFVSHGILALVFLPFAWRNLYLKRDFKPLLAIALAGGSAILCFTYALMYGEVIRVMVLFYLLPVWGVLGGKIFLGEQTDFVRWLGVALALVGAFLLLGAFDIFKASPNWIDLIALASGIFFAANNMVFLGAKRVTLPAKLLALFIGSACLSFCLLILGLQPFPETVAENAWWWLLAYTLTWLLCANLGSQWAITKMEAGRSSIIIIMELVAAVISALIIAGERLTYIEWIGVAMVMIAAYLEAGRANRPSDKIS